MKAHYYIESGYIIRRAEGSGELGGRMKFERDEFYEKLMKILSGEVDDTDSVYVDTVRVGEFLLSNRASSTDVYVRIDRAFMAVVLKRYIRLITDGSNNSLETCEEAESFHT